MDQAPSTVVQVALLVLVVLPGITYQFLRERWRGPVPGERDLGERVLRAVAASIVLDSVYMIVAGPQLLSLVRGSGPPHWNGIAQNPRMAGAVGLLLFVIVPAGLAQGVTWWQRRRAVTRYQSTPTAWDRMFRSSGSCFVRMRLRGGSWVGGWYGSASYATSYPQPPEVYLQTAWVMNSDGSFERPIEGSAGLHVRASEIDVLELLQPPPPHDPDGELP